MRDPRLGQGFAQAHRPPELGFPHEPVIFTREQHKFIFPWDVGGFALQDHGGTKNRPHRGSRRRRPAGGVLEARARRSLPLRYKRAAAVNADLDRRKILAPAAGADLVRAVHPIILRYPRDSGFPHI
jgi:hypothetical protein